MKATRDGHFLRSFFLARPLAEGEFYPVGEEQGIEADTEARRSELDRFCSREPFCRNHDRAAPAGKKGACSSCKRVTPGDNFTRCKTCAFRDMKCRVCGAAFVRPQDRPVVVKPPRRPLRRRLDDVENPLLDPTSRSLTIRNFRERRRVARLVQGL